MIDHETVLLVEHVEKWFENTGRQIRVLDGVSFGVSGGSSVAIVGPSGSGKSTLLGVCAGLEAASAGSITLNGVRLDYLTADELARVRNEMVGFVFQSFQLIPSLTALENVMVPLELRGESGARQAAAGLLDRVGLSDRLDHYPVQLSGGEQQRVAIARAFINKPRILFADEPTGNLDEVTRERVATLLFGLNRDLGTSLILVTHDLELASRTDRILHLHGGRIIKEEQGHPDNGKPISSTSSVEGSN